MPHTDPHQTGVLPLTTDDGAVLVCSSISADLDLTPDGMPKAVRLARYNPDGTVTLRKYVCAMTDERTAC